MRWLIAFLLPFFLVGCIDSAYDDSSTKEISISSLSDTIDINNNDEIDLNVSGMNNTITIKTGVSILNLSVSGSGNLFTIETGVSIDEINISGMSNTFYIPTGFTYDLNNTGTGNQFIEVSE